MRRKQPGRGSAYRIKVRGALARSAVDWFGGIAVTPLQDGDTLLTARFPDQAALRGLLDHLWNRNFTIVSIVALEKSATRRGNEESIDEHA